MTTTSMQFGQSAISVVLNEGQMPLKYGVDDSGATVLYGADGRKLPVGLQNKSVWYRLRQKSGQSLVDSMGNGPDIPLVASAGTPNLWTTAKMATPPDDGTGKATTYARIIGNTYLNELCAIEPLVASQGLLFFAADIYPQAAGAGCTMTQTIFQMGGGTGGPTNSQSFAMTQHTGTGKGRVRLNDEYDALFGDGSSNTAVAAETASTLLATSPGATRSALCGYIDMLNMAIGVSVNGGAFVTTAIEGIAGNGGLLNWNDAEMNLDGFIMLALNPTTARSGGVPVQWMGGNAATLGTKTSGLFITRFDTHPGLDLIDQLATAFNDTVGVFPDDLRTGKY